MDAGERAEIGVCSWSLRPESPRQLVDALRRHAIDAVQLAIVPLIEHPRAWSETFPVLRAAGIRVVSGMLATIGEDYATLDSIARTGGFRRDETWRENLDRSLRVADLAAEFGLRLVTVHAGFLPEDPRDPLRAVMVERLRTVAELFRRRGVVLGLETGQETAATLTSVLDELAESEVGVNFDPANMILYGKGDPVEAFRLLAPRVRQIHVKDALPSDSPGAWGREVPAGDGAVDWEAFGEIYRELPGSVDLVIERESRNGRPEDITAAQALARHTLMGRSAAPTPGSSPRPSP